MALSDVAIKNAKPDPLKVKKLSDGRGLQLWVRPSGDRTWRLYTRANGRQVAVTLGKYPALSLREARLAADRERLKLTEAAAAGKANAEATRFGVIKAQWLDMVERSPASASTREKAIWLCSLFGALDPLPISAIRGPQILELLKPLEAQGKRETAARARSTLSRIFRFAAAHGLVEHDPTALLKGALLAPAPKPRAAIVERAGFARLMRAIAGYGGDRPSIVADGLMLLALTAARPGELRLAQWNEIDLDRAIWELPTGRMKMRTAHRAPLSGPACDILRRLAEENGRLRPQSIFVLPSPRPGRALSENAFNAALRAMGFGKDEMTAHGFRSSFSTLANESGLWAYDAIERQLAHQDASDVRRAYHRADYFEERRRLMDWWGCEIMGMIARADERQKAPEAVFDPDAGTVFAAAPRRKQSF
ncbi:MAG: tyrosine-type recombinase/integrase [Methylocystis sp.]|uniref:tyrosine-type recombinase/integrase n=1 Tax=Methylocystis sp. TaxID=1911079 RepID=UPI003DA54C31